MSPERPPQESRPSFLERRARAAKSLGTAAMIPSMILVGLVGGLLVGKWLEGRYGYEPWFSFGGMVLGGVASVRKIVQLMRLESRRRENRDSD